MEVALVALTWFAGQLVFFHEQWSSGFARVMGDPGAARFIIYVNENWYQSLLGHAAWRTPAFYFPVRNTLGLSDTFLLWQVVYAPARALGADPFLAYQLVLLASSAVGFFTFYLLVRTLWRPPIALALLGAALFTFSNALYANANHPQLFGVLLLPSVCLLGVATWRAAQRGARSAAAWGAAFGALGVLVVYSTYYVGFFAILAVAIAGILTLLITPRSTVARIVAVVKTGWFALVGVALGAVLPAVLFAVTFLPALRSAGGYKLQSANYFAPQLLDLVNVGVGNLLWGTSLVRGAVHGTASLSERDYAITPILLLVTLVAVVLATVRERRDVQKVDRRYSPMILAATGVIMLVLPMSSGNNVDTQHSLWRAVYWIPGASGIRAIDRISVVAAGMLVLALIDAGARLYPWLRARLPAPVLIAGFSVVALVLCLEQVNVTNTSLISRPDQLALLSAAGPPPSGCASFFVESTTASPLHPAQVQTTAMLLSAKYGIPTLNGTSGSFPKGWHLFYPMHLQAGPWGPGYFDGVNSWIAAKHLTHVCALNLDTSRWSPYVAPVTP